MKGPQVFTAYVIASNLASINMGEASSKSWSDRDRSQTSKSGGRPDIR